MGNHNSTVVISMSHRFMQIYPMRNPNHWFGDSSGCSGGTSGLSRVKLQHEERDMRSTWTVFLLSSKLTAADKCTDKAAVCGACRPEPALVTAHTSGTDAHLVTAVLWKTCKCHCLCLVYTENLTKSKAKEDCGGCSLCWILSNHLHIIFTEVLQQIPD